MHFLHKHHHILVLNTDDEQKDAFLGKPSAFVLYMSVYISRALRSSEETMYLKLIFISPLLVIQFPSGTSENENIIIYISFDCMLINAATCNT